MEKVEKILPSVGEVEEWRVCQNYPAYSVSSFGQVKNNRTDRVLKPRANSEKIYQLVHLRVGIENKNGKYEYVHRLVADAFCEKPSEEHNQVDHKDRRRNNNYYKNLQWTTQLENLQNVGKRGERVYKKKTPIVLLEKETNKLIAEYPSPNAAGEELGLSPVQIIKNIHGRRLDFKQGYFMTKKSFENLALNNDEA